MSNPPLYSDFLGNLQYQDDETDFGAHIQPPVRMQHRHESASYKSNVDIALDQYASSYLQKQYPRRAEQYVERHRQRLVYEEPRERVYERRHHHRRVFGERGNRNREPVEVRVVRRPRVKVIKKFYIIQGSAADFAKKINPKYPKGKTNNNNSHKFKPKDKKPSRSQLDSELDQYMKKVKPSKAQLDAELEEYMSSSKHPRI
ncbi:unnamed protein product [Bursaphelenchus xylophilus]|uniref:(pine wood nematode) hypothetical protein n=1 Tax=Bursaphelenchus xylophilus TaxID=6326 RepID=A0A1I7S606_BURXY|nr:unnamed protein product [Bursaphelenchus xylophilus]CAG9082426.1 unnamed protein product [Bursaphelenchus xylophilus]